MNYAGSHSTGVRNDFEDGSVYLASTGLSAESGDDGVVDRGNRANGLTTPSRSTSLEATAGKNPITHVGKLYNRLALRIARRLAATLGATYSGVLSRIGEPVAEPWAADATTQVSAVDAVVDAVAAEFDSIDQLRAELFEGQIEVF